MKTLKSRLFLFVSLMIVVCCFCLGWFLFSQYKNSLREELEERATSLVRKFAEESRFGISTDNLLMQLEPLVESLMKQMDVAYVMVLNREGKVLAHSRSEETGKIYTDELSKKAFDALEPTISLRKEEGKDYYDVAMVVKPEEGLLPASAELEEENPFAELEKKEKVKEVKEEVNKLGAVRIGVGLERLSQKIAHLFQVSIGLTLGFIVLGIGFVFLLTQNIVRPLKKLGRVTETMAEGNLEIQAETKTYREASILATSFNQMAKRLKHSFDEIKRVNKELDAFTYSVSHDLRAPLVALDGFSTILLTEFSKLPIEKVGYYLQRINFNAKKMAKLTDGLLQLSRVGRVVGEKKEIDLTKLMNEIKEEFDSRLTEKEIIFKWRSGKGHEDKLPKVYGDPNQIYRVFANLVGNAIKYSDKGSIIRVGTLNGTQNTKFCTLYVSNTGSHIPKEYREKIFEVFQRIEGTNAEGTGIGLALVEKIIKHHGGKITIDSGRYKPGSKEDTGTAFRFTLTKTQISTDKNSDYHG